MRTFSSVLVVGLLVGVPLAFVMSDVLGDVGYLFAFVRIILAMPFALPWLDPPAEYGVVRLLAFWTRKTSVALKRRGPTRGPNKRATYAVD